MYNWILVAILTQAPSGADPDIISRHITHDACRKQLIYHQNIDANRKYLCLPRDTN
jgi:hypothetical protein